MAHLLYKRQTFISNQGGQKLPQNLNIFRCHFQVPTIKMLLKMGGNWVFSAKFLLKGAKEAQEHSRAPLRAETF